VFVTNEEAMLSARSGGTRGPPERGLEL
jgi:hypothetical protein